MTSFDQLPPDLIRLIFEDASFCTIKQVSLTCKQWYYLLLSVEFLSHRFKFGEDDFNGRGLEFWMLKKRIRRLFDLKRFVEWTRPTKEIYDYERDVWKTVLSDSKRSNQHITHLLQEFSVLIPVSEIKRHFTILEVSFDTNGRAVSGSHHKIWIDTGYLFIYSYTSFQDDKMFLLAENVEFVEIMVHVDLNERIVVINFVDQEEFVLLRTNSFRSNRTMIFPIVTMKNIDLVSIVHSPHNRKVLERHRIF